MKVYEFNLWMDDAEDVQRKIAISATQNLEELHETILKSVDFDNSQLASFFICDEVWKKGLEISLIDMNPDEDVVIPIMKDTRVDDYLFKVGQKVIYEYDFVMLWRFMIELSKIREYKEGETLPAILKSNGEAPPQYSSKLGNNEKLTDEDSKIISKLQKENADLFFSTGDDDLFDIDEEDYDFDDFDSELDDQHDVEDDY